MKAPIGYKAVKTPKNSYGCEFCVFNLSDDIKCHIDSKTEFKMGECSAEYRDDNTNVYFVKDKR